MNVNLHVLLPDRCTPSGGEVIEKLEIAPDGRVYTSCADVAGPGSAIRYDFEAGVLRRNTEAA